MLDGRNLCFATFERCAPVGGVDEFYICRNDGLLWQIYTLEAEAMVGICRFKSQRDVPARVQAHPANRDRVLDGGLLHIKDVGLLDFGCRH